MAHTVGFVGLGNVGLPASRNLLERGYTVLGHDLQQSEEFVRAGGRFEADLAALAAAPVIVFSLPTAAVVAGVVDRLMPLLRPGQLVIDLSSSAIDTKRAQADRLAARGVTLLDCEVSGLPAQVASRKAVIFKAGERAAVERLDALFLALAEQHFYVGAFGAATTLKLIANTMVCVHNLMAAEALNLGVRAGLDAALMVQVLGPSAAGSSTFVNKAPLMLSRQFEAGKGPFRHMFGYLSRAADLARRAGATTPLLDAVHEVYGQAQAQGRHDQDIAAVIELLEHAPPA